MEDTVGLLDDLDNLGLEFDGDHGGGDSPTDPVIAPPESQYVLFPRIKYVLDDWIMFLFFCEF